MATEAPHLYIEQMETKKKWGFAAMSPERRKSVCSSGGKAAHAKGKAHQYTLEEARLAGSRGGLATKRNRDKKRLEAILQKDKKL